MSSDLIERARHGDEEAFRQLVEPHRQELQLHCYRILGSIHDAEDAVQDTLISAWRGLPRFEGRSALRTWLYQIATNRCLNVLRAAGRRPKEAETEMADVDLPEPTRLGEVLWLEPYPDSLLDRFANKAPGPEAIYEQKEAISLAFITALQHLPPRQRAALILRDVLGFHAREVSEILDSTEESVTSALKRARATLQRRLPARRESDREREVVERFTRAFESGDLKGVVGLLTEDVSFTMPPAPFEWQGSERAASFLRAMWQGTDRRLVTTRANGQPAFGLYMADPHAEVLHAVGILVLTIEGDRISAITRFDNSVLPYFALERTAVQQ